MSNFFPPVRTPGNNFDLCTSFEFAAAHAQRHRVTSAASQTFSNFSKFCERESAEWVSDEYLSCRSFEGRQNGGRTNQKNAASTVVKMLKAIAQYLQKELHPLRSKLVRNLRVLDPKNRVGLTNGGQTAIIAAAKELGRFSSSQVDRLALQWEALVAFKDNAFRDNEGIDSYYVRCLRSLRTGTEEYKELEEFIKIALSLHVC